MNNINSFHEHNQEKINHYTKTPNDIIEYCAKAQLTARQYSILLCVIRKTFGFHKNSDWISASQIKEFCNHSGATTHINSDIRKLITRRILIKKGNSIGFNLQTDNWQLTKKAEAENSHSNVTEIGSPKRPKTVTTKETTTKEKILLRNISKEITLKKDQSSNVFQIIPSSAIQPKPSQEPPPKKKRTRSSSKSIKIDFSNLPDDIPLETAEALVEHRKAIKKPLTQYAFNLAMKQAMMGIQMGMSPQDVIDCSILNGWTGINAQWAFNKLQQQNQYMPTQGSHYENNQRHYEKLSTVDEANRIADEYRRQQGLPYTP